MGVRVRRAGVLSHDVAGLHRDGPVELHRGVPGTRTAVRTRAGAGCQLVLQKSDSPGSCLDVDPAPSITNAALDVVTPEPSSGNVEVGGEAAAPGFGVDLG